MKKIRSDYDWAIKKFYLSAKHTSLRATYKMMLMQRYLDENGRLRVNAPSWNAFRQYFYKNKYHKTLKKWIPKILSRHQQNCCPIFVSTSTQKKKPKVYQIDAMKTDVCLFPQHDRNAITVHPYIYLAVDTATQLIAGVYVGLETGDSAVLKCLKNTVCDKVRFCEQFGINIVPEQWPNVGLPKKIITNADQNFCSRQVKNFCTQYGVKMQSLSSLHSGQKSIVKKTLDLIQDQYKPLLRGRKTTEAQTKGHWAVDYHTQTVLNLEEFTEIVIHAILYLNAGRWLSNNKSPAQAWIGTPTSLLSVTLDKLH